MRGTPFSPWPYFGEEERAAVDRVLLSGRVNQWTGEEVTQFEEEFAAAVGVQYAVAVMNGTVALELALRALGVGPGDEVVVTPRSFIASVSCVVAVGATPVFADVERDSGNMTADSIEAVLSPRTRAIIPVHLAGWPCAMDSILELAEEHELLVIEDCAQAHGAAYEGRSVGSMGNVGTYSFCQDKIMTTGGEGGLITTNDRDVWERAWSYRDHGKSFEAVFQRPHPPGFRWLHESFGTNYRMTEMQAAIGRVALRKLPGWVETRRCNASVLRQRLIQHSAFRTPIPREGVDHAYYKLYWFVEPDELREGWSRDRMLHEMTTLGVPGFSGTCSEIYSERVFDSSGLRPRAPLPIARKLGETSLMLPVHPTLREDELQVMGEVIDRVGTLATRTI
jgi:dTDP-4-amino-4,6-dideoxygalactose transaminase